MTVMRFGNGLNGPLSIMKGWSWSGYAQNENAPNASKTATATSGQTASAPPGCALLILFVIVGLPDFVTE